MKPLVLVTGIEGFTGTSMRKELESHGYRVAGTTLANARPGDHILDIECADACNVVGTVNLLEALASASTPPRKVVLASSANVYGNREGDRITEAEEPRPANHYAVSKLAMEKMAANFDDRLSIVITRPFNYTGVGQSTNFLIPKIVSHFARGERRIELGNTDVERDFSDVGMVVQVYRKLLESPVRSTIVNICTGTATSLGSVISMMEEIAGYHIEVRVNPAFVRSNDIRHLTGDPRAMQAAVGEIETRPLRATLEGMYRALQKPA
jgi:nucleoside-diphosphate-sugar epimerase